jgi:hypothetical protein
MLQFGCVLDFAEGVLVEAEGVASVDCDAEDCAWAFAKARDMPKVAKIVIARLRVLFMINFHLT